MSSLVQSLGAIIISVNFCIYRIASFTQTPYIIARESINKFELVSIQWN